MIFSFYSSDKTKMFTSASLIFSCDTSSHSIDHSNNVSFSDHEK